VCRASLLVLVLGVQCGDVCLEQLDVRFALTQQPSELFTHLSMLSLQQQVSV
jgi:hypothetical protein